MRLTSFFTSLMFIVCGTAAAQDASIAASGTVDDKGWQLRYVMEGSGTDALIIGSAIYYPRVFSQELRRSVRMHFADIGAFAVEVPDSVDTNEISLDSAVDQIEAVRVALKLDRFIIVGHSNHGAMALAYAARYPQRVSHVVVIGFGPGSFSESIAYWDMHASPERKAMMAQRQAELAELNRSEPLPPDLAFIREYAHQGPARWYDYAYDQRPLWAGIRMNMPLANRYGDVIASSQSTLIQEVVPNLQVPLLAIMGEHDYPIPPAGWNAVADLPHVTVHVLSRSGHNPMLEEPAVFDRILLDWLGQSSSG